MEELEDTAQEDSKCAQMVVQVTAIASTWITSQRESKHSSWLPPVAPDPTHGMPQHATCQDFMEHQDRQFTEEDFMEAAADFPFCFGRVELYAGTPLLARMLAEDRARGSWMHHDYDLGSEPVERVFKLAVRCLGERNFGVEALVARLMGVRMEVAVASTFHAADLGPRADAITRLLSLDTAGTLRRILDHVATAPAEQDAGLATELLPERRGVDRRVERDMEALGVELRAALAREGRTAGYGEEPLFEGPP